MADLASLDPLDRKLVDGAGVAYSRAAELLSWWKSRRSAGALKIFKQPMPRAQDIQIECFYDTLTLEGKPGTVMAASWKSRFKCNSAAKASSSPLSMRAFLNKEFTRRVQWKSPDGLPGGFTFIPHQYKLQGRNEYGVFNGGPTPDLDEIGTKYDWLVVEAVVHDFFRNTPGPALPTWMLKKMPRMASYVLVHPDYCSSFSDPVPGAVAESCFGYSFLPFPVAKSIFGYGPGQFTAAVKQFHWTLLDNSDVEIEMFFLVSGRSEKILTLLGGFDPVYFTVNVLNALTLNLLGIKRRAHDALDATQLAVHARIYQSLLDGMRTCWEDQNWAAASRSKAGQSGG